MKNAKKTENLNNSHQKVQISIHDNEANPKYSVLSIRDIIIYLMILNP